jgi:hypothetical protein
VNIVHKSRNPSPEKFRSILLTHIRARGTVDEKKEKEEGNVKLSVDSLAWGFVLSRGTNDSTKFPRFKIELAKKKKKKGRREKRRRGQPPTASVDFLDRRHVKKGIKELSEIPVKSVKKSGNKRDPQ